MLSAAFAREMLQIIRVRLDEWHRSLLPILLSTTTTEPPSRYYCYQRLRFVVVVVVFRLILFHSYLAVNSLPIVL